MFHILIALFLMVSTSGTSLSMHYCGGDLVSTSFNQDDDSCCGSHCGGCENETVLLDLDDDFVSSKKVELFQTISFDFISTTPLSTSLPLVERQSISEVSTSVPIYHKTNIRLALLQQFLC